MQVTLRLVSLGRHRTNLAGFQNLSNMRFSLFQQSRFVAHNYLGFRYNRIERGEYQQRQLRQVFSDFKWSAVPQLM